MWRSSSPTNPSATSFYASKTKPISIQSTSSMTVMHEDDYPTPVTTYYASPPPPLSSSISSSSTSSSSSSTSSSPLQQPQQPRKGSIASLLNSTGELQRLDQEEWSTNYQTHFTTKDFSMMVDDEEGINQPSSHMAYPSNKKGLRLFSQHVCDILQQRGRSTYNQLVQQLIEELNETPSFESTCDPKNIRRRVYDALNVLMAIDFITKDKKEIRWKGAVYCPDNDFNAWVASTDSFYDDDDESDDDMMLVERDLLREEQRYQDLTRQIDMKRKEIEDQMQQKYVPNCQHRLPDPPSTSFAT
ncbi:E2F/DP family winged-helix DNA-binding domain-containing protein [Halteromyces radiatus]|uniref:E2F/DP family winged-helix DNA-binding domain-containing protein n=1 Tax=Halteromyces radiatus TaxID=101107 RepID=UPI00221F7251|nr:E2F/DP family winged-helix DNA-binding domain-containing protein [Halteromyces radiatus]KAI8084468.1 E2F/DP family winged-helix DNA-binding domain-containing protein [Halteromyces radiatus]